MSVLLDDWLVFDDANMWISMLQRKRQILT